MDQQLTGSESGLQQQPYQLKVHTFGCKVNSYDSGLIERVWASRALQSLERESLGNALPTQNAVGSALPGAFAFNSAPFKNQVHVINTCAVTKQASLDALKFIEKLKRDDPNSLMVVTGCSAQVDTELFSTNASVDLVVANSHKDDLSSLIEARLQGALSERIFKSNIFKKESFEPGGGLKEGHTRSFLKIQDGCNSFCTYCVIPFARGKSRSLSIQSLITRVNELTRIHPDHEVVLTGVHIGDYQDPENPKAGLVQLVEAILNKTQVKRLRLSSLEPIEVTDDLLELFTDERLCPHFHMSIQSASSKVLAQMKRHYTALDVKESLEKIASRVPGAFVGMDMITGFLGETEEEFFSSVELLKTLPWHRLHVFPYSERPGTMALKMDRALSVRIEERKSRARILRNLSSQRIYEKAVGEIGKVKNVLILGYKKELSGLSRDYWPVIIEPLQSQVKTQTSLPGLPKYASSALGGEMLQSYLHPGIECAVRITGLEKNQKGDVNLKGTWCEEIM